MPRSTPIGDYPSKTAAIIDLFFNKNKKVSEIAAFVDQSDSSVTNVISTERLRRKRKDMSPWQREKAMRILPQVFDVVAEALGTRPSALIEFIKHTTFPSAALRPQPADVIDDSPQVDDEPSSVEQSASTDLSEEGQFQSDTSPPDASAVDGGEEPEPEPADHSHSEPEADVLQRKPATQASWDEKISSGLVTLRNPSTGAYLNLDGSGTTSERRHAYRGTVAQARVMRNKNPLAKGMSFRTFSTPRT